MKVDFPLRHIVLICVILLGYDVSPLKAGSVITTTNASEVTGKLTLTSTVVKVETSSSPTEIKLSDILEADFGETPFQLDFFYGSSGGNQLPATWKQQDIGMVGMPGSVVVNTDGTFTLSGGGASPDDPPTPEVSDNLFFVGQTWMGNGQWTVRVKDIDAKNKATEAGLMLRDTLDAGSATTYLGFTTQDWSGFSYRDKAGKPAHGISFGGSLPFWLRLTRYGASNFAVTSFDGKNWNPLGQSKLETLTSPWMGFYAESRKDKRLGKAVVDHVSFTPPPSSAQVLPPGVLLQSGSFLAGTFEHLTFDPASPDATGNFLRNGKQVPIPPSKIAVVTLFPTTRSQITGMRSHVGVLMKNDDIMDGDIQAIKGNEVDVSSVQLGITPYNQTEHESEVYACFLHSLQTQPANYEIRLRDGSIVNANDFSITDTGVALKEVSGVTVNASLDEIAQFRAGTSLVQSLAELDWKATPPPTAPAANAVSEPLPPVQCWEGKNQEQILETPVGTTLEFPLIDKFRALGVRIAMSPDSPPNSTVTIRVLANGKEIARTPPFKAGDPPRFMEFTLQAPKTVTLVADSGLGDLKVLFIDPVAIREK